MKTLYIECGMGAAGDMLMAALLELIEDREDFIREMNRILPSEVGVSAEFCEKCGITGTHVRVMVNGEEEGVPHAEGSHHHDYDHYNVHADGGHHHGHDHHHEHNHHHGHAHGDSHSHHHSSLTDICSMIGSLDVPAQVRDHAVAVYRLIAEAESTVHGKTVEQIHFHEVGTLDAVADVVGTCLLIERIGPDRIVVSPVHVGSGTVNCAHGTLPVPAPATALLLQGMPVYGGEIRGELCTPTGAALLKHFANDFGAMPVMTIEKTGYGMGTKDFQERPNCVRAILGEDGSASSAAGSALCGVQEDLISELCANIDDMTGEELGFAAELLLSEGALDVTFESVSMKKFRPAVKLSCICRPWEREKFAALILKHTSTIGVREYTCRRFVLARHMEQASTPWGPVTVKVSEGCGIEKRKPEADDIARIALQEGLTVQEVKDKVKF